VLPVLVFPKIGQGFWKDRASGASPETLALAREQGGNRCNAEIQIKGEGDHPATQPAGTVGGDTPLIAAFLGCIGGPAVPWSSRSGVRLVRTPSDQKNRIERDPMHKAKRTTVTRRADRRGPGRAWWKGGDWLCKRRAPSYCISSHRGVMFWWKPLAGWN